MIATYLEPPDLPVRGSSKVCRFPIPMMLVDVSPLLTVDASDDAPATAAGLPKIKLPVKGWGGKEKRLLATLRVKLSLFLVGQNIGLDQLHIPQHEKSDLRRTFRDIQDQLDKKGNLESKLVGAIRSFRVALPEMDDYVSGAVDFLLGVEDKKADDKRYRGGRGVVSLANRKLSLPLEILMSSRDIEAKALELFLCWAGPFQRFHLGRIYLVRWDGDGAGLCMGSQLQSCQVSRRLSIERQWASAQISSRAAMRRTATI